MDKFPFILPFRITAIVHNRSVNCLLLGIIWTLLLGISTPVYSQQTAEFFIDIDPGFGKAETIQLNNLLEAELVLNLQERALSPGMHQIGVRLQNDSLAWGITSYKDFYVPNTSINSKDNVVLSSVNYRLKRSNVLLMNDQWLFEIGQDSLEVLLESPKNEGFLTLAVNVVDAIGRQSFEQKTFIYLPNLTQQNLDTLNAEIAEFLVQSKSNKWRFNQIDRLVADSSLALSDFEPGLQQLYATPILKTQNSAFSGYVNFTLDEALFLDKVRPIYPLDSAIYVPLDTLLSWQITDNALQYRLQLANEPTVQAVLVDTTLGNNPEFNLSITSLEKGATYFWRVQALGDKVNSPWLHWQSFTTERAIPTQTSILEPADEEEQLSVTPIFTWKKNARARSYQLQLSLDTLFQNALVVDSLGIVDTLWVYPNVLAYDTNYAWRIKAENESGTSDWSSYNYFKTQQPPPSKPILAVPQNGLTNALVRINLRWNASVFAAAYDVELAKSANFQSLSAVFTNVTDTTVILDNLDFFTNYYWRVRSVNATTTSEWSTAFSFKTIPFIAPLATSPAIATLSASSDVSQSSAYRLVSLPGNYEQLSVLSVFGDIGKINETWMVYNDNGTEENYLVSQQNEPHFFEPGKALWYLSEVAVVLDYAFSAPKINHQLEAVIPLRAGWNLIGSPFNQENYPWDVVRQHNTIEQPIWRYQGRWQQAQTLEPLKGYYFYNDFGLDTLRLPLVGLSVANKTPKSSTNIEQLQDSIITLTVQPEANREYELSVQWDFAKNAASIPMPMQDFDLQKLWIKQDQLNSKALERLTEKAGNKSSRSSFLWQKGRILDGESFISEEESFSRSTLEAHYEGMIATKSTMFFRISDNLLNTFVHDLGISHALLVFNPSKKYELIHINELTSFRYQVPDRSGVIRLILGNEADLSAYLSQQLPTKFEIERIYPNPFNPSTNIVLNLPKEGRVRLQVYDSNGRLISTLLDQNLSAGSHQIQWNASAFASGVYWVRAQTLASGKQIVQKITLIR